MNYYIWGKRYGGYDVYVSCPIMGKHTFQKPKTGIFLHKTTQKHTVQPKKRNIRYFGLNIILALQSKTTFVLIINLK